MKALVLDAEWNPRPEYDLSDDERESQRASNSSKVWQEPTLHLEDRDRPEPDEDEVLVRVRYAGVCGSDVSMAASDDEGYTHYSAYTRFPTVIGHEFSGEVVETGDTCSLFEPGDPVTAEVTDYCGRCHMCRQGFHGHCENFEQLGFTMDGAFAEYVTVPEKILWDVSSLASQYENEDRMYKAAATIEPSTISYYGLFKRADGILPGDYYVFHGIGPIGLTGMNVSRAAGAGKVIAFEPSDPRREIAHELGFEHVYNPIETDPAAKINEITDGEGADVHVETSGAVNATYPVMENSLSEKANVVHISNAASAPEVALRKYQAASAQIYGTEGHTGQRVFPRTIRMMAAGQLDNLPMVTSTYGLDDAAEAVEQAAKRIDGKVLIEM